MKTRFLEFFSGNDSDDYLITNLSEILLPENELIEITPTPWLTLLLVLGKSRVKQNSC